MRLVLSWLREFVDLAAPADEIAARLGLRGFEVASVERLNGGDAVVDFEITANRPDCLSVLGLAREIATAFDLPLTLPSSDPAAAIPLARLPTGRSDRLAITVEDEELCPRYAGALAEVRMAPSPSWMADRLAAAGVRPISNIVDITNYVNLELGQPMHAFDYAGLAGAEIKVRRARNGERLKTLDGVERTLDGDMLVIADAERAQAVAGVMGGGDSEVSDHTKVAVFESAYFKAASVRRTSKRLGLKTEASARFERGADIGAQVVAIERVAALMARLGAGSIVGPVVDCYPHKRTPRTVRLRRDRLARLFGASVPDADVARILAALGFTVQPASNGWEVVVPLFRVDVLREADLIEEVGRHYGFDRLEPTFPAATAPAPPPDQRVTRDRLVRRVLTAAGLTEAVTFGFVEARAAESFAAAGATTLLPIANPLSATFDTLRPLLLAGLVDAVAHNRRHGRRDVRLFELGTRFSSSGETRAVAAVWTGAAGTEHWSTPPRAVDFFDAKGVVDQLCVVLGVPIRTVAAREPFLVAGQAAAVVKAASPANGHALGVIGLLSPAVADARGLPRHDPVIVAELDLDAIDRARALWPDTTRPVPRFPFVVRDLSIVVANSLPAEIIRGTILSAARSGAAPLVSIVFFDRYQGKGVPEGSISVSIRLTFQAEDRTLTDAEVQQSFDAILAALVREHGAVQR
jgi:phenylalanyl-tRNA synthetase beta chain